MNFKNKLLFVLALLLSSYNIAAYLSQSYTVKAFDVAENTPTIDGLPNDARTKSRKNVMTFSVWFRCWEIEQMTIGKKQTISELYS